MKVTFDNQIFTQQSYGGISRYFVRLAQGLIALGEQAEIVAPLHINRHLQDLPSSSVHGIAIARFPHKTGRLAMLANQYLSKHHFRNTETDILHETYYGHKPVTTAAKASVISVYDMIHEKYPANFSQRDLAVKYKRLAVGRADHVICISHSTKNDLCEMFDLSADKVSVVHLGFEKFAANTTFTENQGVKIRPFLLYVGSRGGYKNFAGMLKAVSSSPILKSNFDIVAFGGGSFSPNEQVLIAQLGFGSGAVRQVGGGDNLLGKLYSQARAFVYPSLYEGFGLPPLEAMAHDCPLVTSNSSSMPEVVGDAGSYFDPLDIDSQARAIESVVFDDQRRNQLILKGRQRLPLFSWNRCATETRAIYQKLLASK